MTTHAPSTQHNPDTKVVNVMTDPSTDRAETPAVDSVQASSENGGPQVGAARTVRVRALVVGALVFVLTALVIVTGWLWLGARDDLAAIEHRETAEQEAERRALDYAVGAAATDYQDLGAWRAELVAGTSEDMSNKLTQAATSMEQLLVPLQWNSTSTPLVATVRSETDGVYVVDSFVSVFTKNAQAPDGLASTATYSITLDSNQDWLITDVGGISDVAGGQN